MSQQVQELINKIKTEGIDEAQKKAKAIEIQAQENAREILAKAQKDSQRLISEAEAEIKKKKESAENAVKQAARDTLLNLRQQIERLLNKIVLDGIGQALTVGELSELIHRLIEKSFEAKSTDTDIRVILSPADLEKLKKGFLTKLSDRFKEGVDFKPAEDMGHGFAISFDGGKSSFDFSDAALAEYLSTYLNPEIANLIKNEKIV